MGLMSSSRVCSSGAMKAKPETDERMDLARAVHQLKETHGARITAHLLYHQARTLALRIVSARQYQ